jgi:hypothetical protein
VSRKRKGVLKERYKQMGMRRKDWGVKEGKKEGRRGEVRKKRVTELRGKGGKKRERKEEERGGWEVGRKKSVNEVGTGRKGREEEKERKRKG